MLNTTSLPACQLSPILEQGLIYLLELVCHVYVVGLKSCILSKTTEISEKPRLSIPGRRADEGDILYQLQIVPSQWLCSDRIQEDLTHAMTHGDEDGVQSEFNVDETLVEQVVVEVWLIELQRKFSVLVVYMKK